MKKYSTMIFSFLLFYTEFLSVVAIGSHETIKLRGSGSSYHDGRNRIVTNRKHISIRRLKGSNKSNDKEIGAIRLKGSNKSNDKVAGVATEKFKKEKDEKNKNDKNNDKGRNPDLTQVQEDLEVIIDTNDIIGMNEFIGTNENEVDNEKDSNPINDTNEIIGTNGVEVDNEENDGIAIIDSFLDISTGPQGEEEQNVISSLIGEDKEDEPSTADTIDTTINNNISGEEGDSTVTANDNKEEDVVNDSTSDSITFPTNPGYSFILGETDNSSDSEQLETEELETTITISESGNDVAATSTALTDVSGSTDTNSVSSTADTGDNTNDTNDNEDKDETSTFPEIVPNSIKIDCALLNDKNGYNYITENEAVCGVIKFQCDGIRTKFFNHCGCGCFEYMDYIAEPIINQNMARYPTVVNTNPINGIFP